MELYVYVFIVRHDQEQIPRSTHCPFPLLAELGISIFISPKVTLISPNHPSDNYFKQRQHVYLPRWAVSLVLGSEVPF